MAAQDRGSEIGWVARLARRGVVAVGGKDAERFLNDLVTADITNAAPDRAVYAGLLTPQGKILFDFIVLRNADGFLFDLARDKTAEFAKRLGFYRLRADVTIDQRSALAVLAGWGGAPRPAGTAAPDPRHSELGWRAIVNGDGAVNATEADYDAHRIALGVPEGGIDFPFGDAFPHDADMDQLGGVAFDKGCYVGQEVVSRMEHRHTARRRVISVTGTGPLPQNGEITVEGHPVGMLGSTHDGAGLALVRLDRVKEAMDRGQPITVAGRPVSLSIPPWARFSWPSPGRETGEG